MPPGRIFVALALCLPPTVAGAGSAVLGEIRITSLLHARPDASSDVVHSVPTGASVDILACAAGWCHVSYATQAGFLAEERLRVVPNSAAALPTATPAQPAVPGGLPMPAPGSTRPTTFTGLPG